MEAELARYRAAAGAATAATAAQNSSFAKLGAMGKWGNQLQWAGRQLMYNFTLPIAIAGAAATKFYMDNERGMTQLRKVYGDLTMSTEIQKNETDALGKSFVALSNYYGINQAEVIKVGAAWAQAGASGIALAKATDLTLQTMILGELDATKATESLIAIQAQYRFNTTELLYAIQQLNIIENQTGTSMAGLIEAMSRSAGVARAAGIDVAHLGAIIAALTPAAGSAAQAGNAIKTIISRLLAPTKQATELLGAMGINIDAASWKSSNASDRLVTLAKNFEGLSDAQKAVVSSTLASRFQINKFEVLMDSITTKGSYYWKALDATADRNKVLAQATRELNQVLTSSPRVFERAWVILQNAMAQIIVPLIPLILGVANGIASLATQFSQLSPEVQKTVAFLLLFLAAIGPIARYVGSVAQLLSLMGRAIGEVGKLLVAASKGLWLFIAGMGPVGWAITAAIVIFMLFQDKIEEIVKNVIHYFQNLPPNIAKSFKPVLDFFNRAVNFIITCFNALPQGVQAAMLAVLNIVKAVVVQVYEWFSYLNPFAHHSPSLVENVTKGMQVVIAQFKTLYSIGPILSKTYQDIKRFGQATSGFKLEFDTFKRLQDFRLVQKYLPGAAAAFRALTDDIKKMNVELARLQPGLDAQQAVVDGLKDSLDNANAALDVQQNKLQAAEDVASGYRDKIDAAQASLDSFANAPLAGMRAMDDQIFQNTIDQKRLQLEMMKMEDVGGTIEDLTAKVSALNGEIEVATATQTELRNAGAGSDITGFYDDQVKALQEAKKATEANMAPLNNMQSQLDALQHKAQEMDLERDLAFDPLTRQIEQASTALNELPFDAVMAGIKASKAEIDKYSDAYANASKEVAKQQAAVDLIKASRDALQTSYDSENAKLVQLQKNYDAVKTAVEAADKALQDIITSINDANQAGAGAGAKAGSSLASFNSAAGGNFPDVGGTTGGVGRELPGIKDQSALIDKFTKDTQDKIGKLFGDIDVFKPLREQWDKLVGWWDSNVVPTWQALGQGFSGIWTGTQAGLETFWSWLKSGWDTVYGVLSKLWSLIGGNVADIWDSLKKSFDQAVGPLTKNFQDLFKSIGELATAIWEFIQPALPVIKYLAILLGGSLFRAFKIIAAVLANVVGPIFNAVVDIIGGVIDVLRGVVDFLIGVFTLDFGKAVSGLWEIWYGLWDAVEGLLLGVIKTVVGTVVGFVQGIVGWFKWLWDELVGHSIIPDMITAIIEWFKKLPATLLNLVSSLITTLVRFFAELPGKILAAVAALGTLLWGWITAAWQKIKDGASEKWTSFIGWVTGLPGKVISGLASLGGSLLSWIKTAWENIKSGASTKWDEFKKWVTDIPGNILKALGNMNKTLWNAGRNLIQGLIDGAGSLLKNVGSWFLDKLPGWIRTPFEHAMGISSPSKVFRGYGKNLIEGLTGGLDSGMNSVEKRMNSLTNTLQSVNLSNVGTGIPTAANLQAVIARADARVAAAATPNPTVYGGPGSNSQTININGDLSFPNITSAQDAKTFLDNLEALAKG
jgi:TP901 family phage tail tape measure protein